MIVAECLKGKNVRFTLSVVESKATQRPLDLLGWKFHCGLTCYKNFKDKFDELNLFKPK